MNLNFSENASRTPPDKGASMAHDQTPPSFPDSSALTPKFIRIPKAVHLTGLSRSKIYELIGAGRIASVSLRDEGQTKATRLISYDSLMGFLTARMEGGQN